MAAIKCEEIKDNVLKIKKQLEILTNPKEKIRYHTERHYFPGIGIIADLDEKQLIVANQKIREINKGLRESAEELDLEYVEDEDDVYGDFKVSELQADVKLRLAELKKDVKINKLMQAEIILSRHLSDEDKFNPDMEEIDSDILLD